MTDLSRRKVLVGAAASMTALGVAPSAEAASFCNPDRPPTGQINAKSPTSLSDPGPQSPTLAGQYPSLQNPPDTGVNGMPLLRASSSSAQERNQNGGWAREVMHDDFAISEDLSGVNMRLAANGVREMHWHAQAAWAIMVDGKALSR